MSNLFLPKRWNELIWKLTDAEADAANPPPTRVYYLRDGRVLEEVVTDNKFIWIGYAKRPKNKVELFWNCFLHGLLMRYPITKVFMFSALNAMGILSKIVDEDERKAEQEMQEEIDRLSSCIYSFGNGQSLSKYRKWRESKKNRA